MYTVNENDSHRGWPTIIAQRENIQTDNIGGPSTVRTLGPIILELPQLLYFGYLELWIVNHCNSFHTEKVWGSTNFIALGLRTLMDRPL